MEIKSAQSALAYSFSSNEDEYKEWLLTRPGRIRYIAYKDSPNEEEQNVLQVQRNIFLKQVKAFQEVDEDFVKADLEKAFDAWLTSMNLDREIVKSHLKELQERFNKLAMDVDSSWHADQRDRDARAACEKYRVTLRKSTLKTGFLFTKRSGCKSMRKHFTP